MAATAAYQAMLDKMKSDPATIARNQEAQAKQFGAIGSQAAATNKAAYEQAQSKPISTAPTNTAPYKPGESAKQSATFNGSNLNDMSGMYLNDVQQTHGQAIGANPLHAVNTQRNASIQDAVASGDWTQYNNWSAQQAPGHYTQGADGNFAQNKDYYAHLIDSAISSRDSGGSWNSDQERDLKETIQKMMNAPGAMPYIAKLNSSEAWSKETGVPMADSSWFNSASNNPQLRSTGLAEQQMWYDNAIFKNDPNLLNQAMSLSNSYGDEESQNQRQAINNQYYANQGQQQIAPQQQSNAFQAQYEQQMAQQQAEYDAKIAAMEKMIEEQKLKNEYNKGEAIDANKGSSNANGSDNVSGEHIFDPGNGGPAYTQTNNSMNDALYRYLDKMWQGGF